LKNRATHPDTQDEPQVAVPSQSQDQAWSPVSDDAGVEVDYGPDSGMVDKKEIAEHYPSLNNHGQPYCSRKKRTVTRRT